MKTSYLAVTALAAMLACGNQNQNIPAPSSVYSRNTKGHLTLYLVWERRLKNCVSNDETLKLHGYFTRDSSELENGPFFAESVFPSMNGSGYNGFNIEEGFLYYRIVKYFSGECIPKYSNNPIIPLPVVRRGKILIEGDKSKIFRYFFEKDSIVAAIN